MYHLRSGIYNHSNRAGIAGFQNFDAGLETPQIVAKRLVFMTPAWKDAFKYTATLADQLGLEMAIAGSPGWSESGGPWVTPAQAMKKYVWSEARLEGGHPFTGLLPKPPSATGPYQNLGSGREGSGGGAAAEPEFYADSAVVAFRAPENDHTLVDVTSALKAGANTLEIKVANLWVNRLIGDEQPGATKKYTYTAVEFYRADSPLLPSGLIGPVKIVRLE
jgi:hypothetical protein